MKQITKKIISYKVIDKDKEEKVKTSEEILPTDRITAILSSEPIIKEPPMANMGEHVERLEVLDGKTYKIKPSTSEHAYYITINNIEVEDKLHPYELFINSKGIEHYKLLGFARLISAIFRKAGDISFLADELKQIYDPTGVYTSKRCYENGKRKRFNSIEAEIGDIIEEHLKELNILNSDTVSPYKEEILLKEKLVQQIEVDKGLRSPIEDLYDITGFPLNATICAKCSYKSVVLLDGCQTCLNCGQSKCE